MPKYIINRNRQDSQSGGNNELHDETPGACIRLPNHENRREVGYYNNCRDAMTAAVNKYPEYRSTIDGCYYCCSDCHRQ